jgi:hypothetical protein
MLACTGRCSTTWENTLTDGGRSHGGDGEGFHSQRGSVSGDGFGAYIIVFLGVMAIGSILLGAIQNTIQDHRDRSFTRQDLILRKAKLSIQCRAVGKRGDTPYIAGRCGPNLKSGVLVILVKGLPADLSLDEANYQRHGSYVGRCELLAASGKTIEGVSEGGSSLSSTPTVGDLYFNGGGTLKLPRNACYVRIADDSARRLDISITRTGVESASGVNTFLIRHLNFVIDRRWYRNDGMPYGCGADHC